MISAESGKTVAKLGKALVRSGNCQWTETISESVWVSKESEECIFKFVVSMGSSRAGILGEATINMASYTSSKMSSSPVLLPLKKCSHGTVLQVKIQCLTPRANISEQDRGEDVDHHGYNANRTGAAHTSLLHGAKLSSSRAPGLVSHQEDNKNKELSYSSSDSNSISDLDRDSRKTEKDLSSTPQRHFGASSKIDSAQDNYPFDDSSFSSQSSRKSSSRNPMLDSRISGKESGVASPNNHGSKHLLEAAGSTIEELRAEAKMWERNARKLMVDLDSLRSEFLDQSKKQADLVMELSAAYTEQGGLKKEVEQLKLMLEDATQKQRSMEDSTFQTEGLTPIQKELESEIKYQQQANANLSLQLQRSQESNIELVSILQELEQTIEQQKAEIENLSALQLKDTEINSSSENTLMENKDVLIQLQQLQDSEKALKTNVQHLEKALHEKMNELEKERKLNSQSLLDIERDYKFQLCVKDEEIAKLQAKGQSSMVGVCSEDSAQVDGRNLDLIKEIEILKEKVQELERDCNELTDENLELLLKLKDSKNQSLEKCESFSSASSDLPTKSFSAQSDVSDTEPQVYDLEFKTKMKEAEQWATFEAPELFSELLNQLEMAVHILTKPLSIPSDVSNKCELLLQTLVNANKKDSPNLKVLGESIAKYFFELNSLLDDRISEFERIFGCSEIEIQKRDETIAEAQTNLEDHVLKVQQLESSKAELEADFQNLQKRLSQVESETGKLLHDLGVRDEQNGILISANELLERKSAGLEVAKQELESKLVQLEEENLLLQGNITGMDNLNENMQVMQAQLLEAQRYSDCLSAENQDLQESVVRLTEERDSLKKLNEELLRKEWELLEHCEKMKARLERTETAFFDSSKKVEALEENLNSTLEAFSLKEKSLKSELENLLQQHKVTANQMHLETLTEVENLQEEVDRLTKEITVVHSEKERLESEISILLADKEKLESAVTEAQSKLETAEHEINTLRAESELQVQSMTSDLTASKQSHETVMANNEKMMKQLATYRATEEKLKTAVNNLELKLTVTEYENQQLREENASKKFQLQNVSDIQDEVIVLKNKVEEYRIEKEKLEASLDTITADYESLKAEKLSCTKRLSSLEESMIEHENYKQKAISLEEKLLQVEGDLFAKETLCVEEKAYLENELSEVKEMNKQYQLKIYQLEEEKSEWLQKARALEAKLEKEYDLSRKVSNKYVAEVVDTHPVEMTYELAEVPEAEKMHKIQLQSFSSEEQSSGTMDSNKSLVDEHKMIRERFERTKSSLETELRDLRERYLQMSLKYAEVEAEREDLVMKLKSVKSGKRWFG
ncbi:OLC1v1034419C3 [Oldenlandia corymbosa var. corymbosa]|nr:OLC1v1034419C3 [Oldenlandia corymbosa var. corymbosa]